MDTAEGRARDTLSIHKYLYAEGDPVDHIDESGNQIDDVVETQQIGLTIDVEPTTVEVGQALEGIARATFADEANEAAAEAAARMIQAAGLAVAVAATLVGVDALIKEKAEECHCQTTPVYHYTDFFGAAGIALTSVMSTTRAYPPDFPAGAYATDISPGSSMTKQQLAATLYFDPGRQARAKNSWFVALCNDNQPGFVQLSAHPRQWVKAGEFPGIVDVSPIIIGINPMREK